ncbi:MAG: biotin--[acetyl-CoA-carboxylase] ligase [Actinomycetota bacterium]|nr:biotin--[acetyl-CoA-carboxylase] ligase [Actinomycetota bacterium]
MNVVDSTNNEVRRRIESGEREGLVIIASRQTGGRGRGDHRWWSKEGKSFLASFGLKGRLSFEHVALFSTACSSAISVLCGRAPRIKWPNDLVFGIRKAGGILAEGFEAHGREWMVVGVGINLGYQAEEFPWALRGRAASLASVGLRPPGPRRLLEVIMEEIDLRAMRGPAVLFDEYNELLAYRGEPIAVLPPIAVRGSIQDSGLLRGILRGVSVEGDLVVEADGKIIQVVSGRLLIRPAASS